MRQEHSEHSPSSPTPPMVSTCWSGASRQVSNSTGHRGRVRNGTTRYLVATRYIHLVIGPAPTDSPSNEGIEIRSIKIRCAFEDHAIKDASSCYARAPRYNTSAHASTTSHERPSSLHHRTMIIGPRRLVSKAHHRQYSIQPCRAMPRMVACQAQHDREQDKPDNERIESYCDCENHSHLLGRQRPRERKG